MSGYLQRLARSVTQPGGNVHPTVGSVFAPDDGRTNDLMEESVTAVAQVATVSRQEQAQEELRMETPEPTMLVQTVINTPLIVSAAAERRPALNELTSPAPLLQPSPSPDKSVGREADLDAPAEPRRNLLPSKPTHAPLPTIAHVRPALMGIASPPKPAAARRVAESVPSRAEQARDDVQIHIGRIEVTAVHQMPTRAPSKPLQKGPSLDDYLKRRDRRG